MITEADIEVENGNHDPAALTTEYIAWLELTSRMKVADVEMMKLLLGKVEASVRIQLMQNLRHKIYGEVECAVRELHRIVSCGSAGAINAKFEEIYRLLSLKP